MVRVVRTEDGSLAIGRMLPGRGAWLCSEGAACVGLAEKRRAFDRALRGPVSAASVAALYEELNQPAGEKVVPGSEGPVP